MALTYEVLGELVTRLGPDHPDRLVMNTADYARLRDQLEVDIASALGIPETLFGVPVSTSEVVPEGQVLRVRPQDMKPLTEPFRGFDPAYGADRSVWFRYGMALMPQRFPSVAITLCEGDYPVRRVTKAQRRRKALRFIREEVALRRMLRRSF